MCLISIEQVILFLNARTTVDATASCTHTHRQRRCNDVDSQDRTRDFRIMGPMRCQLRHIHLRHSVVSTIELVMNWRVFLFVHSCFDRRQSHNRTTRKPQPNHDQTTPNPRAEPGRGHFSRTLLLRMTFADGHTESNAPDLF